MSGRLKDIVTRFLVKSGPAGKAALAAAVGKHPATVDRWIKQGCPSAHDGYRLALACGCSEQEALALVGEGPEAKESA